MEQSFCLGRLTHRVHLVLMQMLLQSKVTAMATAMSKALMAMQCRWRPQAYGRRNQSRRHQLSSHKCVRHLTQRPTIPATVESSPACSKRFAVRPMTALQNDTTATRGISFVVLLLCRPGVISETSGKMCGLNQNCGVHTHHQRVELRQNLGCRCAISLHPSCPRLRKSWPSITQLCVVSTVDIEGKSPKVWQLSTEPSFCVARIATLSKRPPPRRTCLLLGNRNVPPTFRCSCQA